MPKRATCTRTGCFFHSRNANAANALPLRRLALLYSSSISIIERFGVLSTMEASTWIISSRVPTGLCLMRALTFVLDAAGWRIPCKTNAFRVATAASPFPIAAKNVKCSTGGPITRNCAIPISFYPTREAPNSNVGSSDSLKNSNR